MAYEVRFAKEVPFEAVAGLFSRADAPCYCRYYDFQGDHREWQNRCANESSKSREELAQSLVGDDSVYLVALENERVVGWLRASKKTVLTKLYAGRLYRGLPCLNGGSDGVWALGCFLVEPDRRRRGIARLLLTRMLEVLAELNAKQVEAFPRGASDVSDGEQFTGPLALYLSLGFDVISDFAPYPVLRRHF